MCMLVDIYIAQAVSHRLPTAAVRVRLCGICGGHSGTNAGFLRVLRFPLSSIPPIAPHSSSIIIHHHPGLVLASTPPERGKNASVHRATSKTDLTI
jgi:hypothetical protein